LQCPLPHKSFDHGGIAYKTKPGRSAKRDDRSQIFRDNGLEITDQQGRTRASISFHDAVVKDGVTYPGGVCVEVGMAKRIFTAITYDRK
jgi:hypothetical protein